MIRALFLFILILPIGVLGAQSPAPSSSPMDKINELSEKCGLDKKGGKNQEKIDGFVAELKKSEDPGSKLNEALGLPKGLIEGSFEKGFRINKAVLKDLNLEEKKFLLSLTTDEGFQKAYALSHAINLKAGIGNTYGQNGNPFCLSCELHALTNKAGDGFDTSRINQSSQCPNGNCGRAGGGCPNGNCGGNAGGCPNGQCGKGGGAGNGSGNGIQNPFGAGFGGGFGGSGAANTSGGSSGGSAGGNTSGGGFGGGTGNGQQGHGSGGNSGGNTSAGSGAANTSANTSSNNNSNTQPQKKELTLSELKALLGPNEEAEKKEEPKEPKKKEPLVKPYTVSPLLKSITNRNKPDTKTTDDGLQIQDTKPESAAKDLAQKQSTGANNLIQTPILQKVQFLESPPPRAFTDGAVRNSPLSKGIYQTSTTEDPAHRKQ